MQYEILKEHFNTFEAKRIYNVGIYCRISVDDGVMLSESVSIANQKKIIEKYVKDHGWNIYDYYCDDGYSGTNFDRPEFIRLKMDIEKGNINMVITKDLSRLGRDYLKTGFYLDEYFPDHNIRYIAINDNVDSIDDDDDLIPFKNIINEMYAKDVSKKIRFTTQNNIKKGVDNKTSIPLYGYMYDKNGVRVINPETAPVVKLIFEYYLSGMNHQDIIYELEKQKILCPMAYANEKFGYNHPIPSKNKYKWNDKTIGEMLINTAYIGTLTRGKTLHKFKSKKTIKIAKEDQYVFENKFEPIIDIEKFNEVQRLKEKFVYIRHNRVEVPYSQICYCGICGKKLRFKKGNRKDGINTDRLCCRTPYEENKGTMFIKDIEVLLKNELMNLKKVILNHEEEFMEKAKSFSNGDFETLKFNREVEALNSLISKSSKIDLYIKKSFEEYTKGMLPEETYRQMMKNYKIQKESTEKEIKEIKELVEINRQKAPDFEYEARRYVETLKSLTYDNCLEMVRVTSLISKMYIKTDGIKRKRQREKKFVEIIYYAVDPLVKEFLEYDDKVIEKIKKF